MKDAWIEAAASKGAMKDYASLEYLVRAFLEAAAADGWKLVPQEPTDHMVASGFKVSAACGRTWRFMYDAAPDLKDRS